MAETLRRLADLGSFSVLQEKIERWSDKYLLNTDSMNASTCVEVIELNAQVQAQLFKILSLCSDGTAYSTLQARYPWYPYRLWQTGLYPELYPDFYWGELSAKERELRNVRDTYEKSLQDVEDDLQLTREEAEDLQAELEDTKALLADEQRQSTSNKMFTESEMRELRTKLNIAEDELAALRPRVGLISDYERQIRTLREDIAVLTGRRSILTSLPPTNSSLDLDIALKSSLKSSNASLTRSTSPLASDDVTQRVRQSALITRFNDMFAQDRLDAMETLRKFSDDYENNQRIIFTAMQEAFTTAKLAFANHKMRVRSNIATTHFGPETLEEAVQDYINRNTDLYDLPGLVNDVICALNRNPKLLLPGEVTFTIIKPFVRETCKLAWEMSALANPLDIAVACDSELFNDSKYRRSYDSEYSAALVNHHIWPCLTQGITVIMKGEACTKRGSTTLSRSRSPIRGSSSSLRASSPLRSSRARSVSPVRRSKSPLRSMSPTRIRSRSPSPRRLDISTRRY